MSRSLDGSPVLLSATTFDQSPQSSMGADGVSRPSTSGAAEKKPRHKLRNGAACSHCRMSKNKCKRSEHQRGSCSRCEAYKLDCDATEPLPPPIRLRKDMTGTSRTQGKRKRAAFDSRDPSSSPSPSDSASPAVTLPPPFSRNASATTLGQPELQPQYTPLSNSTSDLAPDRPPIRSTRSTPSHSSIVDNHARHVNEEEFVAGTGDNIVGLYHIPQNMWWAPTLVFDHLVHQREEIIRNGRDDLPVANPPQEWQKGDSWCQCMDEELAKELSGELPMLVNEALVDRLSAWQHHRPRLSHRKPPTSRLYLYTLFLLATIHNPAAFNASTMPQLKAATESELVQTMLHSLSPSIETALALELLARWVPIPTDGTMLLNVALVIAEQVGYHDGAAARAVEAKRMGAVDGDNLERTKIWYGLKLSSAIINIGFGRDTAMPPSTLLAEALGHLDLLTPEGVQECQLLVHYRLVEYVVSVYRLIRVHVDEPTAMMQTVDSICEYAKATCKEISEYADNAHTGGAAIDALKAEVQAYQTQLIVQLNRKHAHHFRAELDRIPAIRDSLGTNQFPQHFNGWVHAIVQSGQKFLDSCCGLVHTLHKIGEATNSNHGPYRCWPAHTLQHVAFCFMTLIMAQITSFHFSQSGDGMGTMSDYYDVILNEARQILAESQIPVADVMSSLFEVWQRRKEATGRYFRQKARQRQMKRCAAEAAADVGVSYATPSTGSASTAGSHTDGNLYHSAETMSAALFTSPAEQPLDAGAPMNQVSIDAWFESIFSGLDAAYGMDVGIEAMGQGWQV